jgi:RES domain-containing protein
MRVYRIGSGKHPVFDGAGASLRAGRWNEANQRAIYCGASFAIAMLERLCYTALGRVPSDDRFVEADVPDALIEIFEPAAHAGWDEPGSPLARQFGSRWHRERRSAALLVPSAVTKIDRNLVINQDHPDFIQVTVSQERPVAWDRRLFVR